MITQLESRFSSVIVPGESSGDWSREAVECLEQMGPPEYSQRWIFGPYPLESGMVLFVGFYAGPNVSRESALDSIATYLHSEGFRVMNGETLIRLDWEDDI